MKPLLVLAVALLPAAAAAERIVPLEPVPSGRSAPRVPDLPGDWIAPLEPMDSVPVQSIPTPVAPGEPSAPRVPDLPGDRPWSPPPADDASPAEAPGDSSRDAGEAPGDSGAEMIERGVGIILDNLLNEMRPTFDSMARGLDETARKYGPVLEDLATLIDDVGNYQAPERLANGDILIRRRPDAPPPPEIPQSLRDLTTPRGEAPAPEPDAPAAPEPDPSQPQIDL